jgi:O-antigen ligase
MNKLVRIWKTIREDDVEYTLKLKFDTETPETLIPYISFILGLAICTATSALSIAYTAIAVLVLFRSDFRHHFKLAMLNWYVIGGLLFYLVFLVAVLWTSAPLHDAGKMLVRMIGYLLLPLFFMAFSINNSAKLLLKGFLIGAILSAVLSILSFVFHHHILYGVQDNTWVVFHGHILHNAFLALASIFFLWEILNQNLNRKTRIWFLIAYLICFIDIMFIVNGRTGQLMLLAMSAFLFVYRLRLKGAMILVALGIVVTPLLYFSPMVQKGIQDYRSDSKKYEDGNSMTSVGLRYEFHQKSTQLIKLSPVIGTGTGSFRFAYQNYTKFTGIRATSNPHCDWLWIGVETGGLGIMAFALFLLLNIFSLNKLSTYYKCMGFTLLLGYLLAGLQNSFFIDNVTGMAFIVIMTAIIVAGSVRKRFEITGE